MFYKIRWIHFAILFSFLFFFAIFVMMRISSTTPLLSSQSSLIMDESMTGVKGKRFDKQGQLLQSVTMQSWLHYQGQNQTEMKAPFVTLLHSDGSHWQVSADRGQSYQTRIHGRLEKLQLSQNVIVSRHQGKDIDLELKTPSLLFFPERPIATTEDSVVVEGSGTQIHARGLRADLHTQIIEFLDDVTTKYATPKA